MTEALHPPARLVLTGIGGYLGRHVALTLLGHGYDVTGTLRDLRKADGIRSALAAAGAPVERLRLVAADLMEDRGWAEAFEGAEALVHTASPFPARNPRDEAQVTGPAVEGTRRVLHAAAKAGIRRIVLTSSIAAVSYGSGRAPFAETDWTDPDGPLATPYYRSKTLAERAAWELAAQERLDLTVLNPGMILGPMIGQTVGTSVGVLRSLLAGKYPALPDFAVPAVDVRDVAEAHRLALVTPASGGERLILAGRPLSMAEIAATLKAVQPERAAKVPRIVLPTWLARIASRFDPGLAMIAKELGRDARVSSAKAERLLGWTMRPQDEMIGDTVASLVAQKMV